MQPRFLYGSEKFSQVTITGNRNNLECRNWLDPASHDSSHLWQTLLRRSVILGPGCFNDLDSQPEEQGHRLAISIGADNCVIDGQMLSFDRFPRAAI